MTNMKTHHHMRAMKPSGFRDTAIASPTDRRLPATSNVQFRVTSSAGGSLECGSRRDPGRYFRYEFSV
jgi:hypothetical protein